MGMRMGKSPMLFPITNIKWFLIFLYYYSSSYFVLCVSNYIIVNIREYIYIEMDIQVENWLEEMFQ